MSQNNLENILKNKAFAEKIIKLQTPEEVQAAFKEKGIEISIEEVQLLGSLLNKMVEIGKTKLSEKDLKEVAGGGKTKSLEDGDGTWENFKQEVKSTSIDLAIDAWILTTIAMLDYGVSWAYKKIKGDVSSHKNKK